MTIAAYQADAVSYGAALAAAGWVLEQADQGPGRLGDTWLRTLARRPPASTGKANQ